MQISLNWLNELVNLHSIQLTDLIEKLILGGFEVENILEMKSKTRKSISLDISATANRSDSLSIKGMSTEIASLTNMSIKKDHYSVTTFGWQTNIEKHSNIIKKSTPCSTFITIIVQNITNFTSPTWLKTKLIHSGIKPENTLIDFQNYILLETGYPFEFYDLDKIYSQTNDKFLKLKLTNQKFKKDFSFDQVPKNFMDQLNKASFIVAANDFPISIAGLTVNPSILCSKTTNSLLIEGSIFDAIKIRQQSRILGVQTNRSLRYEKSIKNVDLYNTCYRLLALLRIMNLNLNCQLHTITALDKSALPLIDLSQKTVHQVLGPINNLSNFKNKFLSSNLITQYLKQLNFKQKYNPVNKTWKVQIPFLRSDDIYREIDLIEEIGRLHGFNNFRTVLPNLKSIGSEDSSYQTRKKLISCLTNLGLTEVITYSLVNFKTFTEPEIKLLNPLLIDYSHLRSTLLPCLIQAIQTNLKQQNEPINSFECGHIFLGNNPKNVGEKEYISGNFGGSSKKIQWSDNNRFMNWFEAKAKLEQLFEKLNISVYWKFSDLSISRYEKILHPFCTSDLFAINHLYLGVFGKINPVLAKKLNLSNEIYLFELDFELIRDLIQANKLIVHYGYAFYPKIIKNLSLIISKKITFQNLKNYIYLNGSSFLINVKLLDQYQGFSIPKDCTSFCIQLKFQSSEKTLQNHQIDKIMEHLQSLLTTTFNVRIRA